MYGCLLNPLISLLRRRAAPSLIPPPRPPLPPPPSPSATASLFTPPPPHARPRGRANIQVSPPPPPQGFDQLLSLIASSDLGAGAGAGPGPSCRFHTSQYQYLSYLFVQPICKIFSLFIYLFSTSPFAPAPVSLPSLLSLRRHVDGKALCLTSFFFLPLCKLGKLHFEKKNKMK